MNVLDLSHTIDANTPVFPGTPAPVIEQFANLETDGFREKVFRMASHTSTHLDAPSHIIRDGMTLDQLPVNTFYGPARVIDVRNIQDALIPLSVLNSTSESGPCDFILFCTGKDRHWGNESYFGKFPALSGQLAEKLADMNLKGIGIDAISVDPIESTQLPAHHAILGAGMIIIENLQALEGLIERKFTFSCFPLNFSGGDGSPVRAVAITDKQNKD